MPRAALSEQERRLGDGEEVGGDPAAAESAGIPESLAGACASEAVPHAPVARARRRRSRDSLLPELRQLPLQHGIVDVSGRSWPIRATH